MVSQIGVQPLAEIRQPEHRGVSGVESEVVENHLLARIDGGLFRADPEIRILDVVGGDAGILADEHLLAATLLDREFASL